MEFKYYLYIVVGALLVLMAIYALLTHLFPSISLKKEVVEVYIESPETLVIPELSEDGEFSYSLRDKELQKNICIPFWTKFKIDSAGEISEFELCFKSDDKKLNRQQIQAYESLINNSDHDWQHVLHRILEFYNRYYAEHQEPGGPVIKAAENLNRAIQLNSITIHRSGHAGLSFRCIWDEEHGLGVSIQGNNEIEVGEATEAFY